MIRDSGSGEWRRASIFEATLGAGGVGHRSRRPPAEPTTATPPGADLVEGHGAGVLRVWSSHQGRAEMRSNMSGTIERGISTRGR